MMIRKIRTIAAVLVFVALTALFLDFTGVLHHYLGWLAKMQFAPAVLAGNAVVIVALLLFTLLFGRFYCSVVCPLGVMQDVFNFGASKVKKRRFAYTKERRWVRYPLLALFVLLMILGLNWIASFVEPYSAYGRIATFLFQPVYVWVNNIFAGIAERAESYAFYSVDVWLKSGVALAVAAVTFVVVGVLAVRRGRAWCNTVCPVGTLLGLVSRFALFRPVIDADKCKGCRKCEKSCKASCIDVENHRVDASRCVACMDCIDECDLGAIRYVNTRFRLNPAAAEPKGESVDSSKRKFLTATAAVAAAATMEAQSKRVDGGLAAVEGKKIPRRDVPVKPAGSVSVDNFTRHCTGCQLCVSECPNNVLRPSSDLSTLMQPEMSFERGYCRPECTRCADVCPTGAIRPVSREEKSAIHIGYATVVPDNCLAYRDGVACGNCARHCPAGAILMVPKDGDKESLLVPAVNADKCIGCGACENLCPSRPFSAIFVTGRSRHIVG